MNILITAQCGKLTSPDNLTITYDIAIEAKNKFHKERSTHSITGLLKSDASDTPFDLA